MAKTKKSLLTKAVKGQKTADVANAAVRHVLWALTKNNQVTVEEIEETEEFFDWKCPYTGVDLKERIETGEGVEVDHIAGQNRNECGLNLKGNLVYVDKTANSQKGGKSAEEFLMGNAKCLEGVSLEVRKARLEKIKEFQRKYNYDAEMIKIVLQPKLEELYKEVQDNLDQWVDEIKRSI